MMGEIDKNNEEEYEYTLSIDRWVYMSIVISQLHLLAYFYVTLDTTSSPLIIINRY